MNDTERNEHNDSGDEDGGKIGVESALEYLELCKRGRVQKGIVIIPRFYALPDSNRIAVFLSLIKYSGSVKSLFSSAKILETAKTRPPNTRRSSFYSFYSFAGWLITILTLIANTIATPSSSSPHPLHRTSFFSPSSLA